jgi:multidrug efflux pump subunit AcrA (membrane-fusion protein)
MRKNVLPFVLGAFVCGMVVGMLVGPRANVIGHLQALRGMQQEQVRAPHVVREEALEVRLTDRQACCAGIQTRPAVFTPMRIELELPGEVSVNQDRLARVASQMPGRVEVCKNPGDTVAAGEVIAVIGSRDPAGNAGEPLALYSVAAPLQGTVIEKYVTIGDRVEETPLVTIADLRTLWVVVSVPEQDVSQVGMGQKAVIETNAFTGTRLEGEVTWVSNVLDENTRTLPLRVEVDNSACLLKPGMSAKVFLAVGSKPNVFTVPTEALGTYRGDAVVFVDRGRGRYQIKPVRVGLRSCGFVEILDGLCDGEPVVTVGSSLLLAELPKRCTGGS